MGNDEVPATTAACAIFDMDGLLIDSEPVWFKVQQAALEQLYGIELKVAQQQQFQGASSQVFCTAMAAAYPNHGIVADTLLETLLTLMYEAVEEAPLLAGAQAVLQHLAEQGIPIAIASSSPLRFIEKVMRRHHITVQAIASGEEVPQSKPHPAVFELAAKRLEVAPWQCRVWEDSINGVIAAKAAGMEVVAVPEHHHPQPQKFAIADYIHQSLSESLLCPEAMAFDKTYFVKKVC